MKEPWSGSDKIPRTSIFVFEKYLKLPVKFLFVIYHLASFRHKQCDDFFLNQGMEDDLCTVKIFSILLHECGDLFGSTDLEPDFTFRPCLRRYQVFEMNELHSLSVSISSLNSVPKRKSETFFVFFRKSTFFFILYPYHSPQHPIFMTTFERWRRKWTKVSTTCSPTWWAPHRRRPSVPAWAAAVGRAPPPASPATGRVGNKKPTPKKH